MKKKLLIGIFSSIWYFCIYHIFTYSPLFEYSEKYYAIQEVILLILLALPGILLAFLLVDNSVKKYFKSVGICFISSLIVFILYIILGIESMMVETMTGYEEGSPGQGFVLLATFIPYIISCCIGIFISGIITAHRQNKLSNK